MTAVFLTPDDLAPFGLVDADKAQAMIDDATATATVLAPCITADTFTAAAVVKAILRGAVLRWNDAGAGVRSEVHIGPVGQAFDTRQARRGMFWPSEITQLQSLCSAGSVYSVSLAGPDAVVPTVTETI